MGVEVCYVHHRDILFMFNRELDFIAIFEFNQVVSAGGRKRKIKVSTYPPFYGFTALSPETPRPARPAVLNTETVRERQLGMRDSLVSSL